MSSNSKSGIAERKKFGKTLSKLRKKWGYSSAYGFFHGSGGRKHFAFTYNHYLMIESGQRLPGVDALKKISHALFGMSRMSKVPERLELLQAYLRALSEGDSIFDTVWDAIESGADSSRAPVEADSSVSPESEILNETARRRVSEVPRLSSAQAKAVKASPEAFWCHQWLLQTGRSRTAAALARESGFEIGKVTSVLEDLAKIGVLERSRAGAYRSPFAGTDVFLPTTEFGREASGWLSRTIDARRQSAPSELSGGNHGYFFLTLTSEKEFITLTELFRETMRRAYLYRKRDPIRGKGVLCSAEWRFFKLFGVESEK